MGWVRLKAGVLLIGLSFATPLLAQCVSIPISLEERTQAADQIVLGKLKAKHAYWGPNRQQIFTLNIIEVTAYLKGSGGEEIALVTLGGFIGNKGQITTPSLQIHAFNEYMLFLTPADASMVDWEQRLPIHLPKMVAFADAQGALTKQAGFFHDLYSEPKQTEANVFEKVERLTGVRATTPSGDRFNAREGITGTIPEMAQPITSISPNPTRSGTVDSDDFVTINGSGFGSESNVFFANADDGGATLIASGIASDNRSWSTTQILNKPASGAGTGTVSVNGQTSTLNIQYGHSTINSDFAGFPETTRQRYYLSNIDGDGGVTFRYNTNFAANTAAADAFQRAMETWRCEVLAAFNIDFGNPTSVSSAGRDGTNVVTFDGSLPANVLGRATTYFSGNTNGVCNGVNTVWWAEEIDIQFAPNPPISGFPWNFGPDAPTGSEYDFETVVLHEIGHTLGLTHTIASGTLMHFSTLNGQETRMPNANEIAGVNAKLAYSTQPLCFNPSGNNGPMVLLTPGTCSLTGSTVDLAVNKTVSNSTPAEGDTLTYTITLTNNGPAQATNVSLVDQLPNGVTRTATAPNASQGSFNDANGWWTVGTLNAAANATLNLEVTVDAGASSLGSIFNTTSNLMLDQTDSNAGNNTASVAITVSDTTDLAVIKTVSNSTPAEGDTLTYTITLTNNGPARATNVSLVDQLPNGVTRTATAPNASQGSFNDANGWWTVGTLNAAANATLNLEVTVDAGASSLGSIVNTTSNLMLDQTDSNASNNTGSVAITVSDTTDLAVIKTVSNSTPAEGDTLTYTITLTNNGPARATNVSLVDQLPNGVTRTATAPNASQGSFNDSNGLWTIGTLNDAASATLNLEVTVDAGASSLGSIVNTTSNLMLDQTDSNAGNNTGSVSINIFQGADLAVTKSVDMSTPCRDDLVQFTITVTNNGPSQATSVSIIDQFPQGISRTLTPANPSQGSFDEVTGRWTIGTLAKDDVVSLILEASVDGTGTITNATSSLSADQPDNLGTNNTGTATIEVLEPIANISGPLDLDACIDQEISFSVASDGSNPSYQWFKNGQPITGATTATYTFTTMSIADAGTYFCEISNACNSQNSRMATLNLSDGDLSVTINPSSFVRGLDPISLNAIINCATMPEVLWTDLNSGLMVADNPWVITNLVETTRFRVQVTEGQAQTTAETTILASQNPAFFDFNNDGCNNLLDLYLALVDWNMPYTDDPNGDGFLDIRDLMHLNLQDPLPCP